MSSLFQGIGNFFKDLFDPPSPPPAPAVTVTIPKAQPPVPLPNPNSPAVIAAEQAAQRNALGAGRLATILTSQRNRPAPSGLGRAPTIGGGGGGGSTAGTYGAATLGSGS